MTSLGSSSQLVANAILTNNTPMQITFDRRHVTGYAASLSATDRLTVHHHQPTRPTSNDDWKQREKNVVNNVNIRIQQTAATSDPLHRQSASASYDSVTKPNRMQMVAAADAAVVCGQPEGQSTEIIKCTTTSWTSVSSKANSVAKAPPNGIPRIELDTQFVGSDVSLVTSLQKNNVTTLTTTPGILGLSRDFVVSSDFRRQVAFLDRQRKVPSAPTDDSINNPPPPYNPNYLAVISTSSQTSWPLPSSSQERLFSSDRKSLSPSCEGMLSFDSSAERKIPRAPPTSLASSDCHELTTAMCSITNTSLAATDCHSDEKNVDDDDDVFFTDDVSHSFVSSRQPLSFRTLKRPIGKLQESGNNVKCKISYRESRQSSNLLGGQFNASTSTPVMNLRRLFRFSVRAAEINKSVSSTGSSNGVSSSNSTSTNSSNLLSAEQQKQQRSSFSTKKLYPDLQNMWLTRSTRRTRSLPVRPTRIAVCPTSGDVLVVDSYQQLLQIYTSGGRLESCTEMLSITGACFLHQSDHRLLAVCSGEPLCAVELYYRAGSILIHEDKTLRVGAVVNVVTYRNGLIAVQTDRLLVFQLHSDGLELAKVWTWSLGCMSNSSPFTASAQPSLSTKETVVDECHGNAKNSTASMNCPDDIVDCCPTQSGDVLVLHRKGGLSVIDPNGRLLRSIPSSGLFRRLAAGDYLTYTPSLAADARSAAVICDPLSGQILHVDAISKSRCRRSIVAVLPETAKAPEACNVIDTPIIVDRSGMRPVCVAIDASYNRLFVAISGRQTSVHVYQL